MTRAEGYTSLLAHVYIKRSFRYAWKITNKSSSTIKNYSTRKIFLTKEYIIKSSICHRHCQLGNLRDVNLNSITKNQHKNPWTYVVPIRCHDPASLFKMDLEKYHEGRENKFLDTLSSYRFINHYQAHANNHTVTRFTGTLHQLTDRGLWQYVKEEGRVVVSRSQVKNQSIVSN